MDGINNTNGKRLGGLDHLRQSIRDILTTPIGSRVMLRDYGSRIFDLIDAPMNRSTLLELYAATGEALAKWEPRFKLQEVKAVSAAPGWIQLDLIGQYLPDGKQVLIEGIIIT